MTQELATSEQTHRCPEPELWINSKWRRPRNANDRSKMTEVERWGMDSKLDTTRLDYFTELLSLEKWFGLPTLAAVAITNRNPDWTKK